VTTAAPPRSAERRELSDLYGRYKTLVLAAAAALMLDQPFADVVHETELLLEDCRAAVRRTACFEEQLAACVVAAEELSHLLEVGDDEALTVAGLDVVRATHSRLRSEVWNVLPCEYVPCCASRHTHSHR
jgi:hypothetical protein